MFLCLQNLVMFLSVLVDWMIPDIPKDISEQIKKEKSVLVDFFLTEERKKLKLIESFITCDKHKHKSATKDQESELQASLSLIRVRRAALSPSARNTRKCDFIRRITSAITFYCVMWFWKKQGRQRQFKKKWRKKRCIFLRNSVCKCLCYTLYVTWASTFSEFTSTGYGLCLVCSWSPWWCTLTE